MHLELLPMTPPHGPRAARIVTGWCYSAQCGALATDGGSFSPAEGATLQEAQDNALFDLTSPDARIIASHCNDGTGQGQIAWRP
jgi:hypothetical protein